MNRACRSASLLIKCSPNNNPRLAEKFFTASTHLRVFFFTDGM